MSMKMTGKVCSFIITLVILMGCNSKKAVINTYIFGEIKNSPVSYISLYHNGITDTLPIYNELNVSIALPLTSETFYKIINGDKSLTLYLKPGDTLRFSYNYESFYSTVMFGGRSNAIQNYLMNKQFILDKNWSYLDNIYNLKPEAYKAYCDSVFNTLLIQLNSLKRNLPDSTIPFFETTSMGLAYEQATKLMEYSMQSANSYLIDEKSFFSIINHLAIDDSTLLPMPAYREFINTYVDWSALHLMANSAELYPHEITLIKMQVVSRNFSTGIVKDELLYTILNDHLRFYGLKDTEALFKTFEFQCGNPGLKQKLLTPYKKYLSLNCGGEAPEFIISNLEGKEFKLKSFKGRNICIDVWATWCTACLREQPYFDSLALVYRNKNIEFISLSIDEDFEKWQTYCTSYNKTTNQFWVNNSQQFTSDYLIKTIPHFILIDTEGNIININAPRPSGKLGGLLKELGNKPEL